MKKLFSVLLILTMPLMLSACMSLNRLAAVKLPSLPDFSDIAPAESRKTASVMETIEPSVYEAPVFYEETLGDERIMAQFSNKSEVFMDPETGTIPILHLSFDSLQFRLGADENTAAAERINAFLAAVDETCETGDDYGCGKMFAIDKTYLLSQAEDNYSYIRTVGLEAAASLRLNYAVSREVSLQRVDETVVSVLFENRISTQTEEKYRYAFAFSSDTGNRLFLKNIMTDPHAFSMLVYDEMEKEYPGLMAMADVVDFSDEYDGITWCFTEDGIICFSCFMGTQQTVLLPYERLSGLLKEEYFPQESVAETGRLEPLFPENLAGETEIIDLAVQSESGVDVILRSVGEVRDVMLTETAWDEQKGIYEVRKLWYCSGMTDCAVQVRTTLPETVPYLKVTYTGREGNNKEYFLRQSGENGQLLLSAA